MLPKMSEESKKFEEGGFWNETVFVIPASILLVLVFIVVFCLLIAYRRKR